jgi:hypothetical protein
MNFYIETENGVTKNHPAFEDNLIQAFGGIPDHWERFIRVNRPTVGMYEVLESDVPTYTKIDGIWTDVWHVREMNVVEREVVRQGLIKEAQDAWARRHQAENWSAWVLNEDTLEYEPPIPRPEIDQTKLDAGIKTFWCGADNNWKDTPVRPEGIYNFDFFAWQWVAAS